MCVRRHVGVRVAVGETEVVFRVEICDSSFLGLGRRKLLAMSC